MTSGSRSGILGHPGCAPLSGLLGTPEQEAGPSALGQSTLTVPQWRDRFDGLARAGGLALTAIGFAFGLLLIAGMSWRTDAAVYWLANLDHLYGGTEGEPLAFLYSPAFAQAFAPLRLIPLETFVVLWRVTELAILAYCARWLTLPLLLFAWPVGGEIVVGQTHLILAGLILLTRRYPGLWAAVILTKPTLGVGLAWYVGRRDWRGLTIALGVTLAVVGVSFVLAPSQWFDWAGVLRSSHPMTWQAIDWPLTLRLPIAAGLAYVAGARDWRWLLPIAATLALPTLWWVGLSMLVASLVDLPPVVRIPRVARLIVAPATVA